VTVINGKYFPPGTGPALMDGPDFTIIRERLWLSSGWLAKNLPSPSGWPVTAKSIHRWERDLTRIPDEVVEYLLKWEAETDEFEQKLLELIENSDEDEVTITTWWDDRLFWAENPEIKYPAAWHRALCGRVRDESSKTVKLRWSPGYVRDEDTD